MGNLKWLGLVLLAVGCGGCAEVDSREAEARPEEVRQAASALEASDYTSPSLVSPSDPTGNPTGNYIANWVQVDGTSSTAPPPASPAPLPVAPPPRKVEGLQPSYGLDNGAAAVALYGYDP
jgi:hypothetical protein